MLSNYSSDNVKAMPLRLSPAYLFLEAYFALNHGDVDLASANIHRAICICKRYGKACLDLLNQEMVNKVLKWYADTHQDTETVSGISRLMTNSKKNDKDIMDVSQPVIKIYTLGRFSIVINDETVKFGRKSPKRALELLKALITFGGRDVMIEKVIDVLWPEYDADSAYNVLGTTLYRLRVILGKEAILQNEGRLTLNPEICWVDIWELEKRINTLSKSDASQSIAEHSKQVDGILDLYHGDYLSKNTESYWALSVRERLRLKLHTVIYSLATGYFKLERFEDAVMSYTKLIEMDNIDEEVYKDIMRCYLFMKKPAQGLSTYQRCRKMLHKLLNVTPSNEIELLRVELEKLKT